MVMTWSALVSLFGKLTLLSLFGWLTLLWLAMAMALSLLAWLLLSWLAMALSFSVLTWLVLLCLTVVTSMMLSTKQSFVLVLTGKWYIVFTLSFSFVLLCCYLLLSFLCRCRWSRGWRGL